MNKSLKILLYLIGLPMLSSLILFIAAIPSTYYYFSFIAFIPFIIAVDKISNYKKSTLIFLMQILVLILCFYLMVGIWVIQTASYEFLLGLTIVLPFIIMLYPYIFVKKFMPKYAAVYFVFAWLGAEFLQTYYSLGSPFFNLGNNLGANVSIIQWYEFTGSGGGTLWILSSNFLLLSVFKGFNNQTKLKRDITKYLAVILIPILISLMIYFPYKDKGVSTEVLVVHPNVDNADVKYRIDIYKLMDIYLDIIMPGISERTEYVVLPETSIPNAGWVNEFNRNLVFAHFLNETKDYPNLKLVTGAIAYEAIENVNDIRNYSNKPNIHYSENYDTYYYTYNSAIQLERDRPVQMRVKDNLVPFQEYAPLSGILPRINPVGVDFQFSTRTDNTRVFKSENRRSSVAIICYELVYSKEFYRASRDGAMVFFNLLNEGWYDNLKVSKQLLQLAKIRAIENRRSIAHSSNGGISAIINQRGDVVVKTNSKEPEYLKHNISLNRNNTIAARGTGSVIEASGLIVSLFLMLNIIIYIKRKNK